MSRNRKASFSENYSAPKKTKSQQFRDFTKDETPLTPNIKKIFHLKDLKEVDALTQAQAQAFISWNEGKHLVLKNYAGTGKSFIAMAMGLESVLDPKQSQTKIIIIRSTVQGHDQGHLPGTLEEKQLPFESPYSDICDELFTWRNSYENLKEIGLIEFESTSFLRGRSFDNAVIIFDEYQNTNEQVLDTVLTRIGKNSRFILCGDGRQEDIRDSGFRGASKILAGMDSVATIEFELNDICRSGFVRDYLIAKYSK